MAEYVPPPNYVGEVSFEITLELAGAPNRREQASLRSTVTSNYAFTACMDDPTLCGDYGTCQGPSGCKCLDHWFGVKCDVQTQKLEEGEYVWRGWKILFIVMFLGMSLSARTQS